MLTPFVLLFGLTVATAVIAYWSDNLGKKLGKKRVSLLGLRPRTTATLLTIASSWGIMLFTMAVLLVLWSPLRNALLRYDRERRQNQELRQSTFQLEQEVKTQEGRAAASAALLNTTQIRLTAARDSLGDVRNGLAETRKSLTEARRGERTATRQAVAAKHQVAEAESQLQSTRGALISAQGGLRTIQSKYRDASLKLDQERGQLTKVNRQLADAKAALKQAELAQRQAEAARDRVVIKARAGMRRAARDALRAQEDVIHTLDELDRAQAEVEKNRALVAELQHQAEDLQQAIKDIQSQAVNLIAFSEIRFAAGRTVAETLVAPEQSQMAVRLRLNELWETANRNLEEWKNPNDELDKQLQLTLLELPIREGSTVRALGPEEIYDEVAKFIANRPSPVSVRLVVAANFLQGQKNPNVAVRFVIVPAAPVFNPGEVIVNGTVDGRLGDAKVFKALLDLVEQGRDIAESKGIRPPQSPQLPDFYTAGTNELLFEALRQISTAKRPVPVKIVAAEALNTAEPLKVRFEVG